MAESPTSLEPHFSASPPSALDKHKEPSTAATPPIASTPPTPTPTPSPPSVVRGASLLILLQVTSRLVTFVANQLLLRYLTAPLLGLATQLEVYYLSVLFFSRESLRVAIQRQGKQTVHHAEKAGKDAAKSQQQAASRDDQAIVNLGFLAIGLGIFVSIGLGWLYLAHGVSDSTRQTTPHLTTALYLYGIASFIELLSEPCFVLMQTRLAFGTRATAESVATFLRCIVVVGSAVWASGRGVSLGLLPFALGQLTYGTALLVVYLISGYGLASSCGFSLLPHPVSTDGDFIASYLYRPTLRLAGSMMAQSLFKHLLTQGDTFLISLFSTPEIQGNYALANNYGGLIARLLFQPVEESSRSYFSNLLSRASFSAPRGADAAAASAAKDDQEIPSPEVKEARQSFRTLTRLYLILSAVVVAIGPFASPSLIALVAGRRWALEGAGHVLGVYCFYIPFLALNGITESFVASVASEADVHRQSLWMGAFSLAFAASAFIFMHMFPLGAQGLVLANIVNMNCRIVWSFAFVQAYFRKNKVDMPLKSIIPAGTIALALSTLVMLYRLDILERGISDPVITLIKLAAYAVALLSAIAMLERAFFYDCFHSIVGRKSARQS
ncbi:related to oligosaccharide transporter [Claviceps purpurea 20.1]|uniref:Man(5)GlcNAc(2)-PP-dolichol translocation protein RFT1 n=1 Tax=Claviceps purpurea (strain 20.1) TaxID=1111077 RepID=M1WDN2_CLAP2|nr:related to oligosaccharide transporter [Claviceps purpurea 20.1]